VNEPGTKTPTGKGVFPSARLTRETTSKRQGKGQRSTLTPVEQDQMNMPRSYEGQTHPTVAVGDTITLDNGVKLTVLTRENMPADRYGNLAELTLRRGKGKKTYYGTLKASGIFYVAM
jgi:hypothetical protein